MSMLGRAFAGFGAGVASLATRYLNEEDAANRAKLLADLQHQNMVRADQYTNDPTRRGMLRTLAAEDATSAATATAAAQRAATVAAAGDTNYQGALDATATAEAERKARGAVAGAKITDPYAREKATEDARTQREVAKEAASDVDYLKAQATIKAADPEVAARIKASAASAAASYASANNANAHADATREQTSGLKRINGIQSDMLAALKDDKLTPEQRAEKIGGLAAQLQVLSPSKSGRDPELDTVTTKRTSMDKDGSTVETTEKTVRRPGQGGGEKAPYPDGTELRGKDGKTYVVQGGQPVLKEAAVSEKKPAGMITVPEPDRAPEPSAIDRDIASSLQPLVQEYQQARAQLQAVSRSGDPQAISRYTQAVTEAGAKLRQAAESRLGNGAQRYLSTVL